MSEQDINEIIRSSWFKDISEREMQKLISYCDIREYRLGEKIMIGRWGAVDIKAAKDLFQRACDGAYPKACEPADKLKNHPSMLNINQSLTPFHSLTTRKVV